MKRTRNKQDAGPPEHGARDAAFWLFCVFILGYFHASSTEDGHRKAGHGQGMFLIQQQERMEMRAMKALRREPSDELRPNPQGPGRLDR